MLSTFYFFTGVGDLFLSLILWFILDDEKLPAVVVDGDRVYAVREVISGRYSDINGDCNDDDSSQSSFVSDSYSIEERFSTRNDTFISKRMIEQFLETNDGPEDDWKDDIHEVIHENLLGGNQDSSAFEDD